MNTDPNLALLCPGCFADKGAVNPCPHCGFDEQAPRPAQALALRSLLNGQFLVGRVLGKPGGFGITYLGWDLQLQTPVAIKEYLPRDLAVRAPDGSSILPHTAEENGLFRYGLDQFLAEARTLARMDHPNIVRVRQFFEANRSAYLVMDYYRGLSLTEHLERMEPRGGPGRISERNALALMQPILDGLRAVHAKGFLHRDVKPQNIYLAQTDSGGIRPILLDFGAARQAVGERSRSLSVVISPGYAPFEQYHRKGAQGPPTDIYGAAAVLYRVLTGETPPEATARMADDTLRPAAAFGISQAVSDAIGQGMAMSPAARPQTVQAFQAQLWGTGAVSEPVRPPAPNAELPADRAAPLASPGATTMPVSPVGATSAKRHWLGAVTALMLLGLGGWYQYHQGQMEAQLREAADDHAFETALGTNTDVSYRTYLKTCAADGCGHQVAAEQRLVDLARHKVADDQAFDSAQKEDTDSAFRAYLSACATDGCGHQLAAEQRLLNFETERRKSADDRAFEVAGTANNREAYRAYLDACAADGCGHREEAERQLGKLNSFIVTPSTVMPQTNDAKPVMPAYMTVGPLPPGDLLNERNAPNATAPIINRLQPGTLVAVGERRINKSTKWRRRDGDGGGWLSEQHLRPARFKLLAESSTPAFGNCRGFEPVWSLDWSPEHLTFDISGLQKTSKINQIQHAEGFSHSMIIAGDDPANRVIFQFEAEACPYLPLDALLWGRGILTVVQAGKTKQYLGCCTPDQKALIAPNEARGP